MIIELLFAERNHVCSVCVANGHCELQDLAIAVGMDHVRFDYLYPKLPGRRQPRAVRHRPQPLHPLHPLRAGLRRDRRGPHLGRRRRGAQRPRHHRHEPALGHIADLHVVRQVRAGLPDRRHLRARARPSPRWNATGRCSRSWSPPGRRSNGTSEARDRLARRLLGLPHVVPRPRRVPDRPRREGRPRLHPARSTSRITPRASTSTLVEGAVANEEHLEFDPAWSARARTILVSFGDCAVTGNVTALRNPLGARRARAAPVLHRERRPHAADSRRARDPARCSWTGSSRCTPSCRWTSTSRAARRPPRASARCSSNCSAGSPPQLAGTRHQVRLSETPQRRVRTAWHSRSSSTP